MTRFARSWAALLIVALFVTADVALVLTAARFHATSTESPQEQDVVYLDLLHPTSDTLTGTADGLTLSDGKFIPFRDGASAIVPRDMGFVFRGWAIDTQQAGPFRAMLISVDHGSSEAVPYGVSRPDVAAALHCESCGASGYAITFRSHELAPGNHTIRTRFVTPGASGTVIGPVLQLTVR